MAKSSKYSRSVLGGSDEEYSRSVLGASDEYVSGLAVVGSDAVEEILCEPCQKDGKPTDASLYCIDCSEYLCGECSKFHKKFKSFQHHVIKDVNRAQCEPCQKGGKTINAEKYCTDCKENLCGQCSDFHVKFKAFEHHIIKDIKAFNPDTTKSCKTDTTERIEKMVSKSTEKIANLHIDRDKVQQTPAHPKSSSKAFRKVTAKLLSTIDLTSSKDVEKTSISDLTMVQTHYCVALDDKHKSIKVVDARNMCVTSEIHLREAKYVWAITSVNDVQIAITLIEGKRDNNILFLSVSSSGIISATDHSIRVEQTYLGLVHSKDRFYGTKYGAIDVISMQGRTTINIKSFADIGGIALSNDQNTIYLCSYYNDTVMSLDLNGGVKATYKDTGLLRPDDVTVDGEGYVYVCSTGTKSVYQLAADLSVGHVIVSGVDVLRCTFYKTGNRLILGSSRELKVYAVK